MPRPKKQGGYEKTTITMRADLKARIYKSLPHDGATDLGAFLELAAERELTRKPTDPKRK